MRFPAVSLVRPEAIRINWSRVMAARGSPSRPQSAMPAGAFTSASPRWTAAPMIVPASDLATDQVRWGVSTPKPSA